MSKELTLSQGDISRAKYGGNELSRLERIIIDRLANWDMCIEDIGHKLFLSTDGMKYHMRVIRNYYGNLNSSVQIIHRAHVYGEMQAYYDDSTAVPQLCMKERLTKDGLSILWLCGLLGGLTFVSRATEMNLHTIKSRLNRVRQAFGATSTSVILHRAFLMGLFDGYLDRIKPEYRIRPYVELKRSYPRS